MPRPTMLKLLAMASVVGKLTPVGYCPEIGLGNVAQRQDLHRGPGLDGHIRLGLLTD